MKTIYSLVCLLISATLASLLTPTAHAQTATFTNLWSIPAGLYPDMPIGANNHRGTALNPLTTNVLFASTTGGTNDGNSHVAVLDSANAGAYLGQLKATGVGGGTLNLAPVRVADDGAIYACNVAVAGATFKVYRWATETDFDTPPAVVYEQTGVPIRYGDYMDVRGSGLNTEILVGGSGNGFLLVKPTDATLVTWTNVALTFPGAVAMAGHGIAFDGTNNAFYSKRSGAQTVYRVAYDLTVPTNYVTATFNLDQSAHSGLDYAEMNGVKLLSAVCYATAPITNNIQHKAKVFQLTSPSNYVIVLDEYLPHPNYANPNGVSMTDLKNGFAIFSESGNGMNFYSIGFVTNLPPSLTAGGQPAGAAVVETFNYTFSVNPSGTAPLSYQWYFNATNSLAGATSNSLALSNLQLSQSGDYTVVITNPYGSVTSAVAILNVLPARFSTALTQTWSLAPGARDYLSNDNNQRGLVFDSITGNLILVSRTPTNGIHLINAATGADAGELDYSIITGMGNPGTFPISMVAAANDGVIYAANLLTSATSDAFAVYRWESASPSAFGSVAYISNPGIGRIGDTLIARGSGTSTELLASFRFGTNVALLNTPDGFSFNLSVIAVTNLPPDAQANGFAGLGIAWGPGNTFWAKSTGFRLRLVEYDLASLTGNVIGTWDLPDSIGPIAVDNANGLLAGLGVTERPQNLQLYNLQAPDAPALIDREFFPVNNANLNGTGAIIFDVPGGRLFALDSNNGILAGTYVPLLRSQTVNGQLVLSWAGPAKLYRATTVNGTYNEVPGATSPYTNTLTGQVYYRLGR